MGNVCSLTNFLDAVKYTAGATFTVGAYGYFFWSLPLAASAFLVNLRYTVVINFRFSIAYNL